MRCLSSRPARVGLARRVGNRLESDRSRHRVRWARLYVDAAGAQEARTMPYDLVIKNGVLIDGSGLPRYRPDVGVRHGRIVTIGRIRERAREVIDADGHVVTLGFVDGHTHMDAQICCAPLASSSCCHGITSVVMGNCGFTLAP